MTQGKGHARSYVPSSLAQTNFMLGVSWHSSSMWVHKSASGASPSVLSHMKELGHVESEAATTLYFLLKPWFLCFQVCLYLVDEVHHACSPVVCGWCAECPVYAGRYTG